MFKLGNVLLTDAARGLLTSRPQKYISLLAKHLTGRYGEIPEHITCRNKNSIFNNKGTVISMNEVDGIMYVLVTEIGRRTSISAFYEVQESIIKQM